MTDTFNYDVFLSHSSKDNAVVRPLAERLRNNGLRVWFDDWEIEAADSLSPRERARVSALPPLLSRERAGVRVLPPLRPRERARVRAAKLEDGLEHSRVLVLCMSASAFGSDWANLEGGTLRFRDPLNKDRRFIPLRLHNLQPEGGRVGTAMLLWYALCP